MFCCTGLEFVFFFLIGWDLQVTVRLTPALVSSRRLPLLIVFDILALMGCIIPAVMLILDSSHLNLSRAHLFFAYVLSSGMVVSL